MSRKQFKIKNKTARELRNNIYNQYFNKYFNLFMAAYEWGGLDPEAVNYIMRKFWDVGTIWAFKLDHTDELIFTPYTPQEYNIYDQPINVIPVNTRGVPFIPTTPQRVNVDGVIGYVQQNRKGVRETVEYYCQLLTDIEMVIRTNLTLQKMPWAISCSDDDIDNLNAIFDSILADEVRVFLPTQLAGSLGSVASGAPYIIDKLYSQKQAYENELLTYLGINNMGTNEKKEHLINAEVDANNQLICHSSDNFIDSLETFCEQVGEVLGVTISVNAKYHAEEFINDYENPESEEVEDDGKQN